jgi:hypothetical protein
VQQEEMTSPAAKEYVKKKSKVYFQHIDSVEENLEVAFKLWDAVCLHRMQCFEIS